MWVWSLSFLCKITHFQLSSLCINPHKTFFQLILQSSVFDSLQISIFFTISVNSFIQVRHLLSQFLNLARIIFKSSLHFFKLNLDFSYLLFEIFDFGLFLRNNLLHSFILFFQIIIFFSENFFKWLKLFNTILKLETLLLFGFEIHL